MNCNAVRLWWPIGECRFGLSSVGILIIWTSRNEFLFVQASMTRCRRYKSESSLVKHGVWRFESLNLFSATARLKSYAVSHLQHIVKSFHDFLFRILQEQIDSTQLSLNLGHSLTFSDSFISWFLQVDLPQSLGSQRFFFLRPSYDFFLFVFPCLRLEGGNE